MSMSQVSSDIFKSDHLFVHSFIEAKFSTVTRNQTSDVVLSITNIVSDTMISVVLCVLLWNRHLEVEKSGYVFCPSDKMNEFETYDYPAMIGRSA
jgi:phage pi2 protein 07